MKATLDKVRVDVHQAVKSAIKFFQESFAIQKVPNLQLEEIEMSEDERFWLITLGYDVLDAGDPFTPGGLLPRRTRKYKVVRVNASTGAATAIKIREVD